MRNSEQTNPGRDIYRLANYRRTRGLLIPRQLGVQLIELVTVLAIIAILGTIAVPSYNLIMDRAHNSQAEVDIRSIEQSIERFYVSNKRLPNTLAEIGFNNYLDPWDNNYQYLRIYGANLPGKGSLRKDKNLNPVNTDYDLYSMGKDGDSKLPFTTAVSKDDVVRANNGRFVGLAEDY